MNRHRYQSIPLKRRLKWLENVPRQIAKVPQWLCFKLEPNPDKPDKWLKVPYYADGGKRFGKQGIEADRRRLVQLDEAIERVRKGRADGVGFAPIDGGAASVVDFDGAESVSKNARVLSKTWSEVSVGGVGAHAFVLGNIDSNRKPKGSGVEFFSTRGFIAVTGEPLIGCEDVSIKGKRLVHRLLSAKLNGHAHARIDSSSSADIRNIPTPYSEHERKKIIAALRTFKCRLADYPEWLTVGQALHSADPDIDGPTYSLWLRWSQRDTARYVNEEDLRHRWLGFKGNRGITLATLYGYARDLKAKQERKKRNEEAKDPSKGLLIEDIEGVEYGSARIFVDGLIAEGLTLLTGQKKLAKKTFWLLQCAALTSVGEPFLGAMPSQPLRVLCYMLEEGGTVFDKDGLPAPPLDVVGERLRKMMLFDMAKRGRVRFKTSLPPLTDGGIEQLEQDAATNDLIMIDSRQMIVNEDADAERNIWRKDYQHLLPIREIARRHHCAIVVVNHASKGSDQKEAIDAGASTGGLDAAVDGMAIIQRPSRDEIDRIKMTLHHRRLPSKEIELRWNESTHLFERVGPWLGSGRAAEILGVLVERTAKKKDHPLSTMQIARYVYGAAAGKNRANCSRILVGLLRDGYVVQSIDPDADGKTKLWRASSEAIKRGSLDE